MAVEIEYDDAGRPIVAETTLELYEHPASEPFTRYDEQNDWALLLFLDALCRTHFEEVSTYVRDTDDDRPGWAILLDADRCPTVALPFLAQFVGVTLDPVLSEDEKREKIKSPEGFRRGHPDAIEAAVQRTLLEPKTVLITERHLGSANKLWVRTLNSQTPDPALAERAARSQKAIGNLMTFNAIDGQAWSDVVSKFDTWQDVIDEYPTWTDVISDAP
jgi:hypothetical protein